MRQDHTLFERMQVGETVRELGLEGQKEKEGTPTMGGFIIIMAIVIPFAYFLPDSTTFTFDDAHQHRMAYAHRFC